MRRLLTILLLSLAFALALSACHGGEHHDFVVDVSYDGPDSVPGDGICDAGDGECTLRAAIDESNALAASTPAAGIEGLAESHAAEPPAVTIELATDVLLQLENGATVPAPPDHAVGDLDITADVIIQGHGHTVDAAEIDRAFHVHDGTATFSDLTITRGRVSQEDPLGGQPVGDGAGGGAIRTEAGTDVTVLSSTLHDNQFAGSNGCQLPPFGDLSTVCMPTSTTQNSGGGAIESNGTLTVLTSTFTANQSHSLLLVGGPVCTVCPAAYGGAILSNGPLTVALSTFDDNGAHQLTSPAPYLSVEGSAIAQFGQPTTIVTSTFVDNGSGSAAFPLVDYRNLWGTEVSEQYPFNLPTRASIVRGGYCSPLGTAKYNASYPSVGPLADNGGPTQTRLPGSGALDLIPAGTPGLCDAVIPSDQRGQPRPSGSACDVGAVERQPTVP